MRGRGGGTGSEEEGKKGRSEGEKTYTYLRRCVSIVDDFNEDEKAPGNENDEEQVPQQQHPRLVSSVDLREGKIEGGGEGINLELNSRTSFPSSLPPSLPPSLPTRFTSLGNAFTKKAARRGSHFQPFLFPSLTAALVAAASTPSSSGGGSYFTFITSSNDDSRGALFAVSFRPALPPFAPALCLPPVDHRLAVVAAAAKRRKEVVGARKGGSPPPPAACASAKFSLSTLLLMLLLAFFSLVLPSLAQVVCRVAPPKEMPRRKGDGVEWPGGGEGGGGEGRTTPPRRRLISESKGGEECSWSKEDSL